MASVLRTTLKARVTSRLFLAPFTMVTSLFVMNMCLIRFLGSSEPFIAHNAIYSNSAMIVLYLLCVLESLGFSVFIHASSLFFSRSFKLILGKNQGGSL